MAVELSETFEVEAPIERVWDFLLSPGQLAECMPGASLTSEWDDGTCAGKVLLRIGAISVQYGGRIHYSEVDETARRAVLSLEATEQGGGNVTGSIGVDLTGREAGTSATVNSSFDLTGRLVQVGRGMIEGASAQIIGQFVANVKRRLEIETDEQDETADQTGIAGTGSGRAEDAIDVGALVWQVLVARIKQFFARLFGGRQQQD